MKVDSLRTNLANETKSQTSLAGQTFAARGKEEKARLVTIDTEVFRFLVRVKSAKCRVYLP